MKTLTRRRVLHTAAATSMLGTAGCWGSFNLTGKVYDWNGHFDSKWASWGIFVVFVIFPVYGALLFVDALIINTIEFYSGKNPINRTGPGGAQNTGKKTSWRTRRRQEDPSRLDIEDGEPGQARTMTLERTARHDFRLLDADGRVVTEVSLTPGGGARLRDGEGRELAQLRREDLEAFRETLREGFTPTEALQVVLDEAATQRLLAHGRSLATSASI